MSGKNQYPFQSNWQSTSPVTGFLPVPAQWGGGSQPSGTLAGTMSSTNTIYSNIVEVSRMDNLGIEFSWTGDPTGTLTIWASVSGKNFFDLQLTVPNPAGSVAGFLLNLNQFPFKYLYFKYVNSSGTGALSAYGQAKDLN